jgi:transcriptional regulator with XRE-family HTH domain
MGMKAVAKTKALPNAQLKRLRETRGLSQAKLADQVGCGQGDIAKLETGAKRTTADWAVRIAPALGVDPRELFPFMGEDGKGQAPISTGVDPKKLRLSMTVARRLAAAHDLADNETVISELAAAIYDVLVESEALGTPASDDQAAISMIESVLRRLWRPPPR